MVRPCVRDGDKDGPPTGKKRNHVQSVRSSQKKPMCVSVRTLLRNEYVSGRSSASSDQPRLSRRKVSSAATPALGVASTCPPVGAAFATKVTSAKPATAPKARSGRSRYSPGEPLKANYSWQFPSLCKVIGEYLFGSFYVLPAHVIGLYRLRSGEWDARTSWFCSSSLLGMHPLRRI